MLIEKRSFGGGMDGDTNARDLPDNVMLNCMNARMSVSKYGRNLRLENTPGTTQVSQQVFPPYGTSQTIGTAIDLEEMRLLFFNYNTVGDHGIYCFDPAANNAVGKIYAVLYDSQVIGGLGFSKNSLIHSARVNNGNLYWADSTNNEPRRLNINAGIEMNLGGTFPNAQPYQYPMTQSVVRWIRRQPGLPLAASKSLDSTFLNNFIKNEAFIFQWRYIYRDYEISTLSGFSELMNYNLATDTNNFIPIVAPLDEQIDQDVLQVDYVAKYLNGNKSFIIHSWNKNIPADLLAINAHNAGATALTFNFYNDFTGIALDDAYSVKPFDSLPIYAQTIEMARFRSFMGNYTIGYDTPTITSLTAAAQTSSSATLTGQWIKISDGTNSHYFIDVGSLSGIYDISSQPLPPPYPPTAAFGAMTLVASGPANFGLYVAANYPGYVITWTSEVVTITGGPPVPGISGRTAYKSGASYQLAINFFDHSGRKCGILTGEDLKINIQERVYAQISYTTAIAWALNNLNAVNEIPDWAYYYSIDITKCLTTRSFLQARVKNLTYATKDVDGIYVFNTSAYSPTLNGVAIDITRLNGWGAGYVFSEGDLVKVYIGATVYNMSVVDQDGKWVICELKNLGTIGNTATPFPTAAFELYTPYKPSLSEPYYEVGQIYQVNNPTTISRTYDVVAGSIGGDTTILTRNDGTSDYLTENMSPNDKFYQIWNTDSGRPNFIDTIGQVVKESSIAYSNTFISGTKVNGLSTYDALDTKDIQCGSVTKLQVASKIGEDEGDIMLAICETETASLYLGEVQLVGQATNAFVAQAPGVIGTINVLKGSLGTTRPESVTEYLGLVFGIDLNKGAYWQYSPAGLEPVSRYKQSRFFKNYCDGYLVSNANNLDNINGFHHIRSAINPFHKECQVILPALIYENYADILPSYTSVPSYASSVINRFDIFDSLGKTMCFDWEENKWGNNFQWLAEWQDYLQNAAYGFKNGNLYVFDSNTTNWNTVFGVQYPMRICTTGNINPSNIKDLYNIAIEGDGTIPDYVVALTAVPNQQITDLAGTDDQWANNESVCDATFLTDRLSPNSSGTPDQKLFTGDLLKDFSIFIMCEWNSVYNRMLYVNFINIGYEQSRGQSNITKVINA
jgi:hypothetical protein